ncbi:hypothetical protein Hs20B_03270 [Lactococcus insecticola]|uniref:Uncharacterized protein n=1 Tax=Pseudolactococcus insecticola TaxID=2709158 RepID=A0A6A0B3M0_9LACT|nr:hypothetical protein Hs20B_03270 [Lactococcus insecticola]
MVLKLFYLDDESVFETLDTSGDFVIWQGYFKTGEYFGFSDQMDTEYFVNSGNFDFDLDY